MRHLLIVLLALLAGIGEARADAFSNTPPGLGLSGGTVNGNVAITGALSQLKRTADLAATNNVRFNPAMTAPAWAASTLYGVGDIVSNGGAYFEEQQGLSCTSAGSGGPTGTAANIVDNTCIWKSASAPVVTNSVTPAITVATSWTANATYSLGANVVQYTGSGATAVGNFYTSVGTTPCTAAASGGPTGTGAGIVDNTCTWNFVTTAPTANFSASSVNSFLWNGGAGNITAHANFYGGIVANSGGTQYEITTANTVNGTRSIGQNRIDFVTNSQKFVIRSFEQAGTQPTLSSAWRIIVCNVSGAQCQYVSPKPYSATAVGPGGWTRTIVDFSAVGGREPREIILEDDGNGNFGGIDVLLTEDVYKPGGRQPLAMAVTGDSYPAGGGLYWGNMLAFPNITADALGIRNVINTSIGGCGYIVSCSSGTALTRLSDVTTANNGACPDILIDGNGSNDVAGSTTAAIAAAQTAYVTAFRAACGSQVPIILLGLWAHNNGGLSWTAGVAAETAMQTAAAALNDPLVLFVPVLNDPAGTWMTGTGAIGAAVGTASFATNQMTVTATTSGVWQIGEVVTSSGVTAGTTITAFGTGTGGNGTYTLSTSPGTIGAQAVTANAQNGTGNTDFTLEGQASPPNLHMNPLGNRNFANRLTAAIRAWLTANFY